MFFTRGIGSPLLVMVQESQRRGEVIESTKWNSCYFDIWKRDKDVLETMSWRV